MIDRTKLRLKAEATSDMPSEVVLVLLDDLAAAWAEVARLNSGRDVERNMLWAALPDSYRLGVPQRAVGTNELRRDDHVALPAGLNYGDVR